MEVLNFDSKCEHIIPFCGCVLFLDVLNFIFITSSNWKRIKMYLIEV